MYSQAAADTGYTLVAGYVACVSRLKPKFCAEPGQTSLQRSVVTQLDWSCQSRSVWTRYVQRTFAGLEEAILPWYHHLLPPPLSHPPMVREYTYGDSGRPN
jgi:hypothetical protein